MKLFAFKFNIFVFLATLFSVFLIEEPVIFPKHHLCTLCPPKLWIMHVKIAFFPLATVLFFKTPMIFGCWPKTTPKNIFVWKTSYYLNNDVWTYNLTLKKLYWKLNSYLTRGDLYIICPALSSPSQWRKK